MGAGSSSELKYLNDKKWIVVPYNDTKKRLTYTVIGNSGAIEPPPNLEDIKNQRLYAPHFIIEVVHGGVFP